MAEVQTTEMQRGESKEVSNSERAFYAPFESNVSQEEHEKIRKTLKEWILSQKPILLSPAELHDVIKKELTHDEWNLISDKRDYWPIRMAKGMRSEQQDRFLAFVPNPLENIIGFKRYMGLQAVWEHVGERLFYEKNKRLPSREDRADIVEAFSGEFRVYFALRELALKTPIEYPWAHQIVKSIYDKYHPSHRHVVDWQI